LESASEVELTILESRHLSEHPVLGWNELDLTGVLRRLRDLFSDRNDSVVFA